MIKVPERLPDNRDNRAARRRYQRFSGDALIEDSVIGAITRINETDDIRRKNLRDSNYSLGHTLFKGDPMGINYVAAVRGLSVTVDGALKAKVCEPHQDWLAKIKFMDYFKYPVNGVSLSDIEKMPLPMQGEDLLRVARVFHDPFIFRDTNKMRVRESIIFTAVEPLVHPEVPVPRSLYPLRDRVTAFYDYFASYLTAHNSDRSQDRDFVQMLSWGGELFGQSLGLYTAAASGLAPSSVMKMFKERGVSNSWLSGVSLNNIESEVRYAYTETGVDVLPDDLQPYLAYDSIADNKATSLLKDVYSVKSSLGNLGVDFGPEQVNEAIKKIRKYKGEIIEDSLVSGQEYAKFTIDGHPVIKEVALALRNSKSPHSRNLLVVLYFDDFATHLTLELNGKSNRFYGIPGELSKKVPHIDDLLVRDVIAPAVKQVEERHPELKPKPKSVLSATPSAEDSKVNNKKVNESEVKNDDFDAEVIPVKPPKRKHLRVFGLSVGEPELPEPAQSYERKYNVDYDEAMVRELMGRNTQEADIRQIVEVIKRFETGGVRYRKVVDQGTVRIKSARYRVIFTYEGGNAFSLASVDKRAEAYRQ